MAIPDDIQATDSLKHLRESVNEALAELRISEENLDYKARGNSIHVDFVGGWEGTPFKVYQNGLLPAYTPLPLPGGRSTVGLGNDYKLSFDPYVVEPIAFPGVNSLATFQLNDFDADAYSIGVYIAPGFPWGDEGEGFVMEVRFRLRDTTATFTVGMFGNATLYDKPAFEAAYEDVAPTHDDFIGMWFSSGLSHTSWRKMARASSVTSVDAYMTPAAIDTQFHTFRLVKLPGAYTFEFFFDGASQGTIAAPQDLANWAFGFISGGSNLSGGFELEYFRAESDLNINTRPY